MKKLTKISTAVFTALIATTQVYATSFDTGLGKLNGGAIIDSITSTSHRVQKINKGVDIGLEGNAFIKWNKLNLDSGEKMNFRAIGKTGITVVNSVTNGMSTIKGSISTDGIGKFILSNPNGVLFDGAHFSTAADTTITTQPMTIDFSNGSTKFVKVPTNQSVGGITVKDSTFEVRGEYTFMAPNINVVNSNIKAYAGGFVTSNGADYLCVGDSNGNESVRLEAVNIDGNVYIVSGKGVVKTISGGEINGNLNINSDGNVALNYTDNGKALHVTGDVEAKGNGTLMYARNAKVDGNLNMANGGGYLEVGNVKVGKDMTLKTSAQSENKEGYKHFIHVVGDNTIDGNVNIQSKDNIHIGNYDIGKDGTKTPVMLDGSLKVKGNLTAHAKDGHVMVTVDTSAKNVNLKSDNYNVLSDGKHTITADTYKFSANGYIGAVQGYTDPRTGKSYTSADRIVDIMENYKHLPNEGLGALGYTKIAGGEITELNTPSNAYIGSYGDLKITGANLHNMTLTAYNNHKITITGPNVHAKLANIGSETGYLKLDFEGREFDTNYKDIKDNKIAHIKADEVITYELTDGENGYNQPTLKPGEKTTYLIGPDKQVEPTPVEPDPVNPDPVNPDPVNPDPVNPDPVNPDPVNPDPVNPDPVKPEPQKAPSIDNNNENARNLMTQWTPADVNAAPVNTPVAFAADLDDEEEGMPVRKNVDGSVTVVRAFAVGK